MKLHYSACLFLLTLLLTPMFGLVYIQRTWFGLGLGLLAGTLFIIPFLPEFRRLMVEACGGFPRGTTPDNDAELYAANRQRGQQAGALGGVLFLSASALIPRAVPQIIGGCLGFGISVLLILAVNARLIEQRYQ